MFKRCELHNHTTESDAVISCSELIDIMRNDQVDVFAITDHNTISGHRIVRSFLEKRPPENNLMETRLTESNSSVTSAGITCPDPSVPGCSDLYDQPENPLRSGNDSCQSRISCIYGMEYTTYYGHILCLNLENYVPWDSIDKNHPEKLFGAAKAAGALAGIAHPFSFGDPFARGCHFDMTVTDFSCVDFIEIFNNSEPLYEVNEKALLWWEDLVLSGQHPAATAGMDLHTDRSMAMQFATYIEGEPGGSACRELEMAIKKQRTWISKGVLLLCIPDSRNRFFHFAALDVHKPGYTGAAEDSYVVTLKSRDSLIRLPLHAVRSSDSIDSVDPLIRQAVPAKADLLCTGSIPFSELPSDSPIIPKLYCGNVTLENLVCVAPVTTK